MKNIVNIGKHSKARIERTTDLLYCLSDHLSGKPECRGKEYEIVIQTQPFERGVVSYVTFESKTRLCNDRGKLSRVTASPVIVHVIAQHFRDCFYCSNNCQVQVKLDSFIDGVYKYRVATSCKYRRWEKIS